MDDFTGEAKKLAIQELLKDMEYGDGFDTVTNIIDQYQKIKTPSIRKR